MRRHEAVGCRNFYEPFNNALLRVRFNGILHLVDDALAANDYATFITCSTTTLTRLFEANRTTIHLLSSDGSEFVDHTCSAEPTPTDPTPFSHFPRETGRMDQVLTYARAIPMDFENPDPNDVFSAGALDPFKSGISVPLFVEENAFGIFTLLYNQNITWSQHDLDFLIAIGHLLGIIFKRVYSSEAAVLHAGDLRECRILSQEIKEELAAILDFTKTELLSALPEPNDKKTLDPKDPFYPTPRERELLACTANGLSNREIAKMLFISESTVKKQLMIIMKKAGLRNRAHIAAFAVRNGYAR